MQFFRVCQDEAEESDEIRIERVRKVTDRVPWPVMRLPLGQMAEHPLRLQLEDEE